MIDEASFIVRSRSAAISARLIPAGFLIALLVVVLFLLDGQWKAEYRIRGRVLYEAQPVADGTVHLEHMKSGRMHSTRLDEQGRFWIRLSAGRYRVAVTPPVGPAGTFEAGAIGESYLPVEEIPELYWSPETSGFTLDIPGRSLDVVLSLEAQARPLPFDGMLPDINPLP